MVLPGRVHLQFGDVVVPPIIIGLGNGDASVAVLMVRHLAAFGVHGGNVPLSVAAFLKWAMDSPMRPLERQSFLFPLLGGHVCMM